jgi:hypothetical protein
VASALSFVSRSFESPSFVSAIISAWAAAPAIAKWLGNSDTGQVTFCIMAIQTVIGLLGILIAGKQVLALMKKVPRKQLAKTVWHVLVHGKLEQQVQ